VLRSLAQRWLAVLALLLVLPGVPELLRALSGVEQPCCPLEDCGDEHDGDRDRTPGARALSRDDTRDGRPDTPTRSRGDEHNDEGCTHLRSHCSCCPQAGAVARAALELTPAPRVFAAYAAASTLLRAEGYGTPPLRPPA